MLAPPGAYQPVPPITRKTRPKGKSIVVGIGAWEEISEGVL